MKHYDETPDGKRIIVDCGACGGCGDSGPEGYPCACCNGIGYFVYKKTRRDYEASGRRAFAAGKPLDSCPYRYGWPLHSWVCGWMGAKNGTQRNT